MTREEALNIVAGVYAPEHAALAADLLVAAETAPDAGQRSCAVNALKAIPQEPLPERPPLPDWNAPQYRLKRRFNWAATMAAALTQLVDWSKPFQDDELTWHLRWCQGRMLDHLRAARNAGAAFDREAA